MALDGCSTPHLVQLGAWCSPRPELLVWGPDSDSHICKTCCQPLPYNLPPMSQAKLISFTSTMHKHQAIHQLNKDASLEVLLSHINLLLSIFSQKNFKKDKNPEWSYPSYTLGKCTASLGSFCSPGIILFIQKSNTGPWTSPLPHPPSWKSLAPLLQSQSFVCWCLLGGSSLSVGI